jgi:hypothetical protein
VGFSYFHQYKKQWRTGFYLVSVINRTIIFLINGTCKTFASCFKNKRKQAAVELRVHFRPILFSKINFIWSIFSSIVAQSILPDGPSSTAMCKCYAQRVAKAAILVIDVFVE